MFAVLVLLVRHHDRVVRQAEMLDSVWGTRCVSVSTLTSRVKAARRAIGDDGTGQRMIRTVRGVGYRFVAPIHEHADPEATGSLPQDIRFCRGHDGVRIALARVGTGPVLVKAANWMTHLGFDVDSPFWRHWLAGLSTGHTLVRYDARGCGLSSWEVAHLGFEDWVRDLELVADALDLRRFPLIGLSHGGAVAIGYAARHPERVSHLVLVGACARGPPPRPPPAQRWPPRDELPRRTTSPGNTLLYRRALAAVDVRRAAADVGCPTLVLHARGDRVVPLECAAELAAAIPGSRLSRCPAPATCHGRTRPRGRSCCPRCGPSSRTTRARASFGSPSPAPPSWAVVGRGLPRACVGSAGRGGRGHDDLSQGRAPGLCTSALRREHEQRVADGALTGRVGRVRDQLPADGHGGRAATVEVDGVGEAERPCHVSGFGDAQAQVSGAAPVRGDQHGAALRVHAGEGPRVALDRPSVEEPRVGRLHHAVLAQVKSHRRPARAVDRR